MKNFINTIGNRIGDLPTCSEVPQPTAEPRAPFVICKYRYLKIRVRDGIVDILYWLVAIQPRNNGIIHVSAGHSASFLLSTGCHFEAGTFTFAPKCTCY
jgi:hypothetical protein